MPKRIRVSLANKCQLLFGVGVVLILVAALLVVSRRMNTLVEQGPLQRAQDIANLWLTDQLQLGTGPAATQPNPAAAIANTGIQVTLINREQFEALAAEDPFVAATIERFENVGDQTENFATDEDPEVGTYYRYARAVRTSDLGSPEGVGNGNVGGPMEDAAADNPLEQVLFINLIDQATQRQRMVNRIYLLAAGLLAGLLAIAAFWFITTRLVLSPVRVLRGFAEKVAQGDLNLRSDINTGDEFEQLSDMFNAMLDNVRSTQDKLQSANKSLDLKLGELAESNVALHEANKVKGDFLANVSHELRTPLNSIIGFAEVMQETLADRTGPVDEKRKRYAANIINSSRRLLELINDLLDLAKIEAGRMELRLATVSIQDTTEGLANLIRPQAEKRGVNIRVKVQPNLPAAETDPGKLQQVLFNFLANAAKFTAPDSVITLAAALEGAGGPTSQAMLRLSVSDQGPGIAPEDHPKVFEKFSQIDPSVTREHGGTGLGLTISKELAELLGGRIELTSELGKGATFAIIIPLIYQPPSAPLMPAMESM
ncbi:HAMP domain-containing sensor histidine kinase [Phycisphaeraceae bacterium D3-23]